MVVTRTLSVRDWIDMVATELDVDGLEFYWGFTPHDDLDEVQALRSYAAERRLSIPMMCYSPDFTHPDPSFRQAEVEKQRHAIAVTAALGGKYCRVLSGQRRPEVSIEDGVGYAASCITQLMEDAMANRVVLILENHYKDGYWEFPEFAQRQDVFLKLLSAIPKSPWFGVNYDPSNAIIAGDDPIELLELVAPRVVSMHASDRYFEGGTAADLRRLEAQGGSAGYASILKHGVIGRGLNDYDRIFKILKSVGFTGWISIEDGQDPDLGLEHLALSADFLREKMIVYGLP